MNVIVVFLIPAAFIYYSAGRSESGRLTESIAAIAGLASGFCAILVDRLFSPLFSMPVTAFYPKLLILFFSDTFIPIAVGLLPLFFLSDSTVRQKISLLRPQIFGVTALYLPYKMYIHITEYKKVIPMYIAPPVRTYFASQNDGSIPKIY